MPANQIGYADSNIERGKRYWYKIRAYNQTGFSDYSLISTPTRTETKDFLNSVGDFERISAATGIAEAWVGNTECANCEYHLNKNEDGSKTQYFGYKGPDPTPGPEGTHKYMSLYPEAQILIDNNNENFVHHGDNVVLDVDKYSTFGMIGKNNSKLQVAVFFYDLNNNEISHLYYPLNTIADDTFYSYKSDGLLVVPNNTYYMRVIFSVSSEQTILHSETMGASIDGVKMSIIRSESAQTIVVPAPRNRAINSAEYAMNPNKEDLYEAVLGNDMITTLYTNYAMVLGARYYNPNIKLIGYTSADFTDYRKWDQVNQRVFLSDGINALSPIPFGWALDQQNTLAPGDSWFFEYPENMTPSQAAETGRANRGASQQYEYDNDGATKLNYVFGAGDYYDRYMANLDSQSYRDEWVKRVIEMYKKYDYDGLFLDDTGPYWANGRKTLNGTTTTEKAAEINASQVQSFLHYIIPRINAQLPNIEWLQNADVQHYADDANPGNCQYCGWYGRVTLKPDWDPAFETAGQNGMPSNYNAANYTINTFENTPKTFFNENSYLRDNNNASPNLRAQDYRLHDWTMSIKDIDVLSEFNKLQPDEKKKKQICQSLPIINNPNTNNFANNPPVSDSQKANLSKYDDGWSPFVLTTFLLNSNKYSYIGAMRINVIGTGLSAVVENARPKAPDIGFALTVKLGNASEDRKIVYNGTEYDFNNSLLDNDAKKVLQYRKFQNGLIVVNGSPDQNQSFTLPTDMKDEMDRIYFGNDKNITLLPHTGRVFFTLAPIPTPTPVIITPLQLTLSSSNFSSGWNMIGFPDLSININTKDLIPGVKIKKYDGASNSYQGDDLTITPGAGYWIYLTDVNSVNGKKYALNQATSSEIAVTKGWNLLGNPYQTDLPYSNLQVKYKDSTTRSYAEAITRKEVSGYAWSWEASDQKYYFIAITPDKYKTSAPKSTIIKPFRGFWMIVKSDTISSIIIKK